MDGINSEMPAPPDNIAASLRKSRRVRILFVFLTALLEPCEDSVYEIVEPLGSGSMGEVSPRFRDRPPPERGREGTALGQL